MAEIEDFLKNHNISSSPLGNDACGVEMLEINNTDLVKACDLLKTNPETSFDFLMLMTSLDLKKGYQMAYLLHSTKTKKNVTLKVTTDKTHPEINSVSSIWAGANWYEREAYDMMGIKFTNHPNLKRILNPDNWEGFPLRKDYIPPFDALNGLHPLEKN